MSSSATPLNPSDPMLQAFQQMAAQQQQQQATAPVTQQGAPATQQGATDPMVAAFQKMAAQNQQGQQNTNQPQYGTNPGQTQDLGVNLETGIDQFGNDVANSIKNIPSGIWHALPPIQLHDQIKQALPVIDAYEKARHGGAGIMDSIRAANTQAEKQDAAKQQMEAAIDAYKKNPAATTIRGVLDAGAIAASLFAGGEGGLGIGEEAGAEGAAETGVAERAATTPKPGLIQQVVKGEKVGQQPARAAMTEAAGEGATPGMRSMMDKNIAESGKAERAAYDTLKEKTGVDLKDLYDYRTKIQDAIDNPANIDREDLLQDKLKDVEARIAHAESDATRNLVNAPEKLKEAEGLTQKRYAQEELKKRLFNNESVVSGNVEHGAEESIDVEAAIREVEKLNKPSRYAPEGAPTRLQQALGKDGAKKLLDGLYDAKKTGKVALRKQQVAKWVAGVAGTGSVVEIGKMLLPQHD